MCFLYFRNYVFRAELPKIPRKFVIPCCIIGKNFAKFRDYFHTEFCISPKGNFKAPVVQTTSRCSKCPFGEDTSRVLHGIPRNFRVKYPRNSAKFRGIPCIAPKIPYSAGSKKTTSVDTLAFSQKTAGPKNCTPSRRQRKGKG